MSQSDATFPALLPSLLSPLNVIQMLCSKLRLSASSVTNHRSWETFQFPQLCLERRIISFSCFVASGGGEEEEEEEGDEEEE